MYGFASRYARTCSRAGVLSSVSVSVPPLKVMGEGSTSSCPSSLNVGFASSASTGSVSRRQAAEGDGRPCAWGTTRERVCPRASHGTSGSGRWATRDPLHDPACRECVSRLRAVDEGQLRQGNGRGMARLELLQRHRLVQRHQLDASGLHSQHRRIRQLLEAGEGGPKGRVMLREPLRRRVADELQRPPSQGDEGRQAAQDALLRLRLEVARGRRQRCQRHIQRTYPLLREELLQGLFWRQAASHRGSPTIASC